MKKFLPATDADRTTLLVAVLTVALWGSAFPATRVGLTAYAPESLALLRYLIASSVLAGYALIRKMPLPHRRDLLGLAGIGFVGLTLYNLLVNAGERTVPAGPASLIIAAAPIFTALMARMFLKERLPRIAWGGIGVCFAGVALISLQPGDGLHLVSGAGLLFLGAIASAGYSVGQKNYLARYSPMQVTTLAIWFGTLFLLVFIPNLRCQLPRAQPSATLAAIYLGIVPGAIGYLGWSFVFSHLPAARAGSFLFLVPVFSSLIAWLWLGEGLPLRALVGGALILAGTTVIHSR